MNNKFERMEMGGKVNQNILDFQSNEFLVFVPQQEKEVPVYARMMVKGKAIINSEYIPNDENMPHVLPMLNLGVARTWATNKYISLYGSLLGTTHSYVLSFEIKKKDEDDIILHVFPGCIFSPDKKRILFLITSTKQDWDEPKEALKAYVSKELVEDPIYKTFYRKFEKEFLSELREESVDIIYTSSNIRKKFFVSKVELGMKTLDGIQKYLKGKDAKSDLFFDPVTEAIEFLKKVRKKNFSVFRNMYNSLPNDIKKGLPPNLVPFEFGSIDEKDVMETVPNFEWELVGGVHGVHIGESIPVTNYTYDTIEETLRHGTGIREQLSHANVHHYSPDISVEDIENAIRDVDEEIVHSFNSHTIQQRLDDLRRLNDLRDSYTTEELEQLHAITPEMARARRSGGHRGFGASSPISDDNPLNRGFTVEERALEELRRGQAEIASRVEELQNSGNESNPYRGRYYL